MRICRLSDGSLALQYGDRYPDTFVRDAEGHYTSELSGAAIEERGDGGFLIRETDGGMMNFGSDLLLESISDANGNEVSLLYDAQKHLVEIRHSCGDRFTLDYNADGFVYRLTDAAGLETRYTYDTTGRRLVSVATPDGGVLSYEYTSDAAPALASITDPSGVTVHFAYGGDGRLTETYLNDHRYPVKSTYDLDTRITTYTDASGGSSTKKLNEFGQVLWETNALGETTRYTYDDDRNLARITDAGGSAYSFEYDERDNLIRITDPLNHAITMGYEPDSDDLAWVRDGRNNQVTFDYDGHGNVNRVTYPDATHEDRTYNAAGNPVTTVTRKGDEISYTYNQRGQVARKEYPDGTWFAYTYDSAGNTITATDQSGTIAMEYTLKDQLSRISYPSGQWLAYTYDAAGRLLERTDQDGTAVRYEYDALGQLMRVKDEAGSVVVEYEYDDAAIPPQKSSETAIPQPMSMTPPAGFFGWSTLMQPGPFFHASNTPTICTEIRYRSRRSRERRSMRMTRRAG
jgi:YD repeat-containing protein